LRIRGVVLADYVKIVRTTRNLDWESFLNDEDWEIIKSMVIPTEWYPAEVIGRIGRGMFVLLSNSNYEFVRAFGRKNGDEHFDPATQKFFKKDDPVAALGVFAAIASRFADEINAKLEKTGENFAEVTFFPVDGAPSWDCYREVQAGYIEWIVEENGGKNPRAEIRHEEREGREACIIRVTWEK